MILALDLALPALSEGLLWGEFRLSEKARSAPSHAPRKPSRSWHTGNEGCRYRKLERVKGIEPSSSAWEAAALPLSYTRIGA